MKPGTAAFAIQAVPEACPGVGEAMVLTWSSQIGAVLAGMEMDTPFHITLWCLSLPGVFSKLSPSGGIWWLGKVEDLGRCWFLRAWEEECSFHSSYPVHGRLAVIPACAYFSGLKAKAPMAEVRWVPLPSCLANGQLLICLDFVPWLLTFLVLRAVFSGPFGLSCPQQKTKQRQLSELGCQRTWPCSRGPYHCP